MKLLALAFGWPPSELDALDMDELQEWVIVARQKLEAGVL